MRAGIFNFIVIVKTPETGADEINAFRTAEEAIACAEEHGETLRDCDSIWVTNEDGDEIWGC